MMMRVLLLALLACHAKPVLSQPAAAVKALPTSATQKTLVNDQDVVGKVLEAQGQVSFNGRMVKANDPITSKGVLRTGNNSKAKLVITTTRTFIYANPNTEIVVAVDNKAGASYDLKTGFSRWLFEKAKAGQPTATVKTEGMIMGVRGTDFIASYHPGLQESEVVCFEGIVQVNAVNRPNEQRTVTKNMWGGIGGRFGKQLAPVLRLPPQVIQEFDAKIPKGKL